MADGSYRINAVTTTRETSLGSASPGLLSGLLWGISEQLADHPDALVSLAVEYQPDVPATPLGGRVEVER